MIKGQYHKVRDLIKRQNKIILRKVFSRELKELIESQIKDASQYQDPEIITPSKKPFSNLKTTERGVYVLMKSGAFTHAEVSNLLSLSQRQVERIYERIA